MRLQAQRSGPLAGHIRLPGDKSISHRALILAALAEGVSEIEGLLEGEDVLRTAAAMAAFGARVERLAPGRWRVEGRGGFAEPEDVIDCGNSGTGVRLILGAAAGQALRATFTGDASLRGRPMGRVTTPLAAMGARFLTRSRDRLPLTMEGGDLRAIEYRLPVASAQVKSAILLAALRAQGRTEVIEPEPTRDHTERMLAAFGAALDITTLPGGGRAIAIAGGQPLRAAAVDVPGDPSSAAFLVVAALIVPGSDVTVKGVLLNPLRTGLYDTLRQMGGDLEVLNLREAGGESVGDLRVRHSPLRGLEVPPGRAPSMIDEYPILAVAAAFAAGETRMAGIGEMRVKESDRIALMARGLAACGVDVREEPEGLVVRGGTVRGGAEVAAGGDHRIAMSHLVLGLAAAEPVAVDSADMIATSFPDFVALMSRLGAPITPV